MFWVFFYKMEYNTQFLSNNFIYLCNMLPNTSNIKWIKRSQQAQHYGNYTH